MNKRVSEIIKNNNFGIKEISELANIFFEDEKLLLENNDIELFLSYMPHLSYGGNSYMMNSGKSKVRINVMRFVFQRGTKLMKTANLHNTVAHEFEHARTFILARDENFYDFDHFISFVEYLSLIARHNINFKEDKINLLNGLMIKKYLNSNHSISTAEIKSNLEAYKKTLCYFDKMFDKENKKDYANIIDSLEFLDGNIEIVVNEFNVHRNKYILIFERLTPYIKKNPEILEKHKVLKRIFDEKGNVKHIFTLFEEITPENKKFMDNMITHLLLVFNYDLREGVENPEFKKYLEEIIVKYNNKVIESFSNYDKGKVFVKEESLLADNFRLQKQNVLFLREISQKYNLIIESGIVLDCKSNKNMQKKI